MPHIVPSISPLELCPFFPFPGKLGRFGKPKLDFLDFPWLEKAWLNMSKGVIIEWPFDFENPGIVGIFGNLKVPLPKSKPKMFEPQERAGRSKIEGFQLGRAERWNRSSIKGVPGWKWSSISKWPHDNWSSSWTRNFNLGLWLCQSVSLSNSAAYPSPMADNRSTFHMH